jgi:hypothetical protein
MLVALGRPVHPEFWTDWTIANTAHLERNWQGFTDSHCRNTFHYKHMIVDEVLEPQILEAFVQSGYYSTVIYISCSLVHLLLSIIICLIDVFYLFIYMQNRKNWSYPRQRTFITCIPSNELTSADSVAKM